ANGSEGEGAAPPLLGDGPECHAELSAVEGRLLRHQPQRSDRGTLRIEVYIADEGRFDDLAARDRVLHPERPGELRASGSPFVGDDRSLERDGRGDLSLGGLRVELRVEV